MSTALATTLSIDQNKRMTKAEAEMHEKIIFDNIYDSGNRLLKICVERGWESMGYVSFREYASYVNEKMGLGEREMYNLLTQARVNNNLGVALGKPIVLPVRHALALGGLEPEKQIEAYKEALSHFKKGGPKLTDKEFQRAAGKFAPKQKAKRKVRALEAGWDADALSKDQDLSDHFEMIEVVYGKEDTKAIQDGTVPMKRADVFYLGRLPKERMLAIQDLLFTTRWTPLQCIEFLNTDLDDNSTIEDLKNMCLTTKGKFWSSTFGGFTVSIKSNKKIR